MEWEGGCKGLHFSRPVADAKGARVTPREAGAAQEVPEVLESPCFPSPWLAAALSGPSTAQPGGEATAIRYWGPELCNYHERLSYFWEATTLLPKLLSSKPKQDGKSPSQDAASAGRGEVNPLPPGCLYQGAACAPPTCTPQHPSAKCFGCTGGVSKWGAVGEDLGSQRPQGVWQAWDRAGGSPPSSAAGRFRGHIFGCFSASTVRTAIYSSFWCKGSSFGAFPEQRLC